MNTPTPFSVASHGGVSNTRPQQSESDATLEDLINEHRQPVELDVDADEYHSAEGKEGKRFRSETKKALPYFVGGTLDGKRHDTNVTARTLLTLDIEQGKGNDSPPPHPRFVAGKLKELGGAGWLYTSLSHTSESPRYRVVLPLGEPITGDLEGMQAALQASTLAAAKRLGIDEWCQPESWVLSQPMYLPAKLKGGTFYQAHHKGKGWRVATERVGDGSGVRKTTARDAAADIPDERPDPVLAALKTEGSYLRPHHSHKGMHFITCPHHESHDTENDSKTVYYEAHFDGNPRPAVKCMSTSHDELTYATLVRYLKDKGILSQEQQHDAGVLDDYDVFDKKAELGRMLEEEPVAREWAINQFAPCGKVTVLSGPGGVSKSMLMLHLMVYAAMDQPWAGFTYDQPLRSLYVSYEDDTMELHKRVNSLAGALREADDGILDALYDINGTLRKNLRVFAADDEAAAWLLLTKPERFGAPERTERVDWLVGYMKAKKIKLLCLDPAVYTHQLEENDISDMATLMQTLTYIAKQTNAAVVVLHHMNKAGAWSQLDEVNQGSLRGASSFADNARSVGVVVTMPVKDAETYGLPPDPAECSKYAVFKHVKHNYSAPMGLMVFERKGPLLVPTQVKRMTSSEVKQARETMKEAEANHMTGAWADRVVQALAEYDEPVSLAQIAHDVNTRTNRIKSAVQHCVDNDWVETEPGSNRAQLHRLTKLGKAYARQLKKRG